MNKLPNELTNHIKEFVIFKPEDYEELRDAVKNWIVENDDSIKNYGHISTWDTSLITNMSGLFHFDDSDIPYYEQYDEKYFSLNSFNDDISNWDVSNVTSMSNMFSNCTDFNQPLNKWDVSKVENMSYMFSKCVDFNQPLDNWDISSVLDMTRMFYKAYQFNQNISMWDLTKVKKEKIFVSSNMEERNKPNLL